MQGALARQISFVLRNWTIGVEYVDSMRPTTDRISWKATYGSLVTEQSTFQHFQLPKFCCNALVDLASKQDISQSIDIRFYVTIEIAANLSH